MSDKSVTRFCRQTGVKTKGQSLSGDSVIVRQTLDPKANLARYYMLAHGSHLLDTARYLAGDLLAVSARLSRDKGLLGGGMVAGIDLMRPVIAAEVARRAMAPFRKLTIAGAELLDNVGVIGAAALGRQAFLASAASASRR